MVLLASSASAGERECVSLASAQDPACASATSMSIQMRTLDSTPSMATSMTMQVSQTGTPQGMLASQQTAINANMTPDATSIMNADFGTLTERDMEARWNELEASGMVPGLDMVMAMTSEEGLMKMRQSEMVDSPAFGGAAVGSDPAAALASFGAAAGGADTLVGGNNAASGVVSESGASINDIMADNPALSRLMQNPMHAATPDPLAERGTGGQVDASNPWLQNLNRNMDRIGTRNSNAGMPSPMDDASPSSSRGSDPGAASGTQGAGRPTDMFAQPSRH
jgi:hypothetical protein